MNTCSPMFKKVRDAGASDRARSRIATRRPQMTTRGGAAPERSDYIFLARPV